MSKNLDLPGNDPLNETLHSVFRVIEEAAIIHWPVNDLKELIRMLKKILNDTNSKHSVSSKKLPYLIRAKRGRGVISVEHVYN